MAEEVKDWALSGYFCHKVSSSKKVLVKTDRLRFNLSYRLPVSHSFL